VILNPFILGSAVFTPASLAWQFWHEADGLSLADGDPVASYTDLSGNAYHGIEATNRPTFKTNQFNTSKPTVRWDGTNDRLATPSVAHNIGTGGFTIYVVARWTLRLTAYKSLLTTGSGGNPGLYLDQSSINFYWGADHRFSAFIDDEPLAHIICVQRSGSTVSLYHNDPTTADATTFSISTSMANGVWYLGNENSGAAATLNGDMPADFLSSEVHNATVRGQMFTYLNSKYAIY
jgi:hypothetical protein